MIRSGKANPYVRAWWLEGLREHKERCRHICFRGDHQADTVHRIGGGMAYTFLTKVEYRPYGSGLHEGTRVSLFEGMRQTNSTVQVMEDRRCYLIHRGRLSTLLLPRFGKHRNRCDSADTFPRPSG